MTTENETPKNNTPETIAHKPLPDMMTDIMETIDGFQSLLMQETEALQAQDFQTVDALQKDKRHFAKTYADKVSIMVASQPDLTTLDTRLRDVFIEKRTSFTQTLNDNMKALDLAKRSAARLANRIMDAARAAVREEHHTHYGENGKTEAYKAASMSLRLDQTL